MKNCELCNSKFGLFNAKFVLNDGHVICTKCTILLGMIYKPDIPKYKATPFKEVKSNYLYRSELKDHLKNEPIETNTNILKCPRCESTNVDFMQNNKKDFSIGKAAAGAALTGGIGTLAGFAGKKGNNQWHCKSCGNVFETKKN